MGNQQKKEETLCAPVSGRMRGHKGDAYVIDIADEENGDVVAPADGTVMRIGDGGNRISICTHGGNAVTVGIGLTHPGSRNTTDGCHFYVREGEEVNRGQRLMHAQLSQIRRMGGGAECVMLLERHVGGCRSSEVTDAVRAGVTPLLYLM